MRLSPIIKICQPIRLVILLGLVACEKQKLPKMLLVCQLSPTNIEDGFCRRENRGLDASMTVEGLFAVNKKITDQVESSLNYAGVKCQTRDLSDRVELRALSLCYSAKGRISYEVKSIWPHDARAVNYYQHLDMRRMRQSMIDMMVDRIEKGALKGKIQWGW